MPDRPDATFLAWLDDLERRHLADLSFPEVRRALQALSRLYVERRSGLGTGAALDGAGKRAAFALFFGPLHFLTTREIVLALGAHDPAPGRIIDLGAGTGAAGAAWALACPRPPRILAVERSGWALEEARLTYRQLGLSAEAHRGDVARVPPPEKRDSILLAYVANEMEPRARAALLGRLLESASRGSRVLVIEPIAKRPFPWWGEWEVAFRGAGGRTDAWRFPAILPERQHALDRAAGLDHRELTARSLYLGAGASSRSTARTGLASKPTSGSGSAISS